jgi:adenylate cyclase, class 2
MSERLTAPENRREIELRTFDVDSNEIRHHLQKLGAHCVGIFNYKRAVLDVDPVQENKWIRVRTDGEHTTLAIKERISQDADGTGEVEIETSSFDDTLALLQSLNGYIPRSYQENTREQYDLGGTEISIDTWPQLGDVLEIEGISESEIYVAAKHLRIDPSALTGKAVEVVYQEKLGIDVKTTDLRF